MSDEPISSFCYLNRADLLAAERLINRYQQLRNIMNEELDTGRSEELVIRAQRVSAPIRNPLESGNKYEADIDAAVRKYCKIKHQALVKKWNTATTVSDRFLDLIQLQTEFKTYLDEAEAKRPSSNALQRIKLALSMPQETRAALAQLEAGMKDFSEIPLQDIFGLQHAKLEDMSGMINQLDRDHSDFCVGITSKDDTVVDAQLKEFDRRDKAYAKIIGSANSIMQVAADNLPRLSRYMNDYKRSAIDQWRVG